MLLIVKNVTASSEEAKVIEAGQEIDTDLKDLLECVLHIHTTRKQRLTCLNDSAL